MKKIIFLFVLAVFYASIGLAKTPEIINPPRPHAKFRWLLVIEHTLYPGHTHFLYVDKYNIFQESDGWVWILPEERYEAYSADKGAASRPDTVIPIIFHSIILSYPEILRHTIFLRSKAPKPVTISDVTTFNDPKKFMNFWTARAKKIKVSAKKARIVFR